MVAFILLNVDDVVLATNSVEYTTSLYTSIDKNYIFDMVVNYTTASGLNVSIMAGRYFIIGPNIVMRFLKDLICYGARWSSSNEIK